MRGWEGNDGGTLVPELSEEPEGPEVTSSNSASPGWSQCDP